MLKPGWTILITESKSRPGYPSLRILSPDGRGIEFIDLQVRMKEAGLTPGDILVVKG